uniref:Pentatricopeptide repeat-containing protein n=1 Tax=Populus alba TaxID=43335 RepID=A0A4U5NB70_POPAL|nr:pentatricopeptide repeat-containing protein [Populus alba]
MLKIPGILKAFEDGGLVRNHLVNKMNGGLVRNHSQADKITDKRYVQKKGLSKRSDQAFLERGYGEDFEVERAAFKSFEQSNDVIGKTKVPMWKIEEKIQKLGNWCNHCSNDKRFCMMLEKEDFNSALACITTNSAGESQAFCKGVWLNLFEENAQRFRKDTLIRLMHKVRVLAA